MLLDSFELRPNMSYAESYQSNSVIFVRFVWSQGNHSLFNRRNRHKSEMEIIPCHHKAIYTVYYFTTQCLYSTHIFFSSHLTILHTFFVRTVKKKCHDRNKTIRFQPKITNAHKKWKELAKHVANEHGLKKEKIPKWNHLKKKKDHLNFHTHTALEFHLMILIFVTFGCAAAEREKMNLIRLWMQCIAMIRKRKWRIERVEVVRTKNVMEKSIFFRFFDCQHTDLKE